MKKKKFILICTFLVSGIFSGYSQKHFLLETETFKEKGGWCMDHQAFNKIGSAYLLANGAGTPVEDARTEINLQNGGTYHMYVNTYNWTTPWYDGKGPGAFCIKVNGRIVTDTLGTSGKKWGWQYAGKVQMDGLTEIALHDLTGFYGRVDAVYFTKSKEKMPDNYESMLNFTKEKLGYKDDIVVDSADLVVVGGGVAGCATALTASRLGLKVILIDNLPRIGGNNYLGVELSGMMCYNIYPNVGNMVRELSGIQPIDYWAPYRVFRNGIGNGRPIMDTDRFKIANLREKVLNEEENIRMFQSTHIFKAEHDGRTVTAVTGRNLITNRDYIFKGKRFVDCTGDGAVGYLLGAEFRIGREPFGFAKEPHAPETADKKTMGGTILWDAVDEGIASDFPTLEEMPWAMQCSKKYFVDIDTAHWTLESGFEINNAEEPELVRDNLLRAVVGNWSYLKHNLPKYKTHRLAETANYLQKRESRRLIGDLILTENDIINQVKYPDATFTTTWSLDVHYPRGNQSEIFPGWEWHSRCTSYQVRPYHVPYRVLYSKDFDNLFIGGRNMSVTHMALGTVRVQATLGMAGEVIGMAAKVCNENNCTPKQVYENHFNKLKSYMRSGAPIKNHWVNKISVSVEKEEN